MFDEYLIYFTYRAGICTAAQPADIFGGGGNDYNLLLHLMTKHSENFDGKVVRLSPRCCGPSSSALENILALPARYNSTEYNLQQICENDCNKR